MLIILSNKFAPPVPWVTLITSQLWRSTHIFIQISIHEKYFTYFWYKILDFPFKSCHMKIYLLFQKWFHPIVLFILSTLCTAHVKGSTSGTAERFGIFLGILRFFYGFVLEIFLVNGIQRIFFFEIQFVPTKFS